MQPKQPDFAAILTALEAAGVRYVLIGGMAMVAHGSAYVTVDLDVCYSREQENLAALGAALVPFHPRLRTAAGPIPFLWEARTLRAGMNFALETDKGDLDVLGDVPGVGSFDSLWERAVEMDLFGTSTRVASIDDLIAMKRAAGRAKDQAHIAELESLKRLIQAGGVPNVPDETDGSA